MQTQLVRSFPTTKGNIVFIFSPISTAVKFLVNEMFLVRPVSSNLLLSFGPGATVKRWSKKITTRSKARGAITTQGIPSECKLKDPEDNDKICLRYVDFDTSEKIANASTCADTNGHNF